MQASPVRVCSIVDASRVNFGQVSAVVLDGGIVNQSSHTPTVGGSSDDACETIKLACALLGTGTASVTLADMTVTAAPARGVWRALDERGARGS